MTREQPTAVKSVLAGGLWSSASQLLPLVGTTALSVTLARRLGAGELGLQSFIAYVEAVLATLFLGALTATAVRSLAATGHEAEGPAVAWWSQLAHAVTGGVLALVLVGVGLVRDASERGLWLIAALSVAVFGVNQAMAARSIAAVGYGRISRVRLLTQSLAAAAGVVAVLLGAGIAGVLWANVGATLVSVALLRRGLPGPQPRRGPLPTGLPVLLGSFLLVEVVTQVVSRRVEFLFLDVYSTTTEIAQYSIPFMVVTAVTAATSGVFLAAMPAVARQQAEGRHDAVAEALGRAFRVSVGLAAPLAVGLAATGPRLVEIVYGAEFARAADLVPLMSAVVLVTPVQQLCASYWSGLGRLRPLLTCGAVAGVLDVALAAVLIPSEGALGAAVANVAGQAVFAVLLAVVTWQHAGRFDVDLRRQLAALPGSALALVLAEIALHDLAGATGLVASGALAGAVLALNGLVVGYLGPYDGKWLRDALPGPLRPVATVLRGRGRTPEEQPPAHAE